MPVSVSITLDTKAVRQGLRLIGSKAISTAANQSINRALSGARTEVTRFLAPKTEVRKQRSIRDRIEIIKSTRKSLRGAVIVNERNISLNEVKNVRVSGSGKKQSVKWKGRTIRRAFRIKGAVGALNLSLIHI